MTLAESRFMDVVPRALLAIVEELRIANKLKVFELKRRFGADNLEWKDINDKLEDIAKGKGE